MAVSTKEHPREEPAPRADIVDRNGEILASTLMTASLYADPTRVWDAAETAGKLAGVLPQLDVETVTRRLSSGRRFVWIRRDLTPRERQAVFELGLPGLGFVDEPKRVYPRGRLAAHVLGFADVDGRGAAGAERAFDAELSAGGGRPLPLSIDIRAQHAVDEELRAAMASTGAQAAAALVTDVRTGEILALVSLPDFDPNDPGRAPADARLNRPLAAVYELGSVFKTISYAAALDAGVVNASFVAPTDRPLQVGPNLIKDSHPVTRPLTVRESFVRSSNVAAAYVALRLAPDAHEDYLTRFGLMHRAPVAYAESARPLRPQDWDDTARATVAYGHGLAVSPAAFAAAFNAVVNGGLYVRPTLRPANPRGALSERVISPQTSAAMRGFLRAAVVDGTGRRADVPGYYVGGKTGTAEKVVDGAYDTERITATFAAVFPVDAPRYSVLVVLDEPVGAELDPARINAGYTAAPTAGLIISRLAAALGVTSRGVNAPVTIGMTTPPSRGESEPHEKIGGVS